MFGNGYYIIDDDIILEDLYDYDSCEYFCGELEGIEKILKWISSLTKNGVTISICINCERYNLPHFNYEKGKKYYSIEFERAVPLDYGNLMELKERTDLEIFFATYNEDYKMTNWQLAVKTWNDNNKIQIPNNLHKPYYRKLNEEQ